jgi:Ca-activated chloride channel family protein
LLTKANMMIWFMLIAVVNTGADSFQAKALTSEPHPANLAYSTTAVSDQIGQSQNAVAPEKSDDSLLTLHTAVSEVHLVFTVTDKQGRYIRDLKQKDFTIFDDRKPPKEILGFHSETELPLQVGILIDTSQSVHERFQFEQDAAIEFLNQTIRPKYDQSFIMGFSLKPQITQDFTADREKLSAGIHMLQPGNLTAIYDAVYYACGAKLLKQAQPGPVRRAIILLSDGNDNSSSVSRETAIEMAQAAEVAVYAISTNLTPSGGKGRKNLERIADATGGRLYTPSQITEVAKAFASIQEELRSQYVVSYKPEAFKLDGHYRSIEVQTLNQKGLRIRCRKGYRSRETNYSPNE